MLQVARQVSRGRRKIVCLEANFLQSAGYHSVTNKFPIAFLGGFGKIPIYSVKRSGTIVFR